MSTTSMTFSNRHLRSWFASIGKYLAKIIYAPGVTQLPLVLTSLLFVILLFNAMTTTMVFAFSPRLIKSFGISEIETATYVGYLASSMFVGQSLFSFLWGYVGDVKGKRFAVFWACICASAVSLAFGFSKSFWWAVSTRFLLGACGVNITVTNLVFEICDNTNKSIGMAVCITSYAVGLVLGPSLGGFMVFLREQYPGLISRGSFLDTYKVFLPNLILSLGFLIMPIMLICVIEKRKSKDSNVTKDEQMNLINKNTAVETDEVDVPEDSVSIEKRSVILSLLSNKQCILGCFIMTLFHFFGIGFNEIYPVWADSSLEFHGLNFSVSQIGMSLLIAAVVLIFAQPVILSRTATYFGVKQVFMYGLIVQMVLYPLYPLVAEITNRWLLWVTLCTLIIITRIAVGACFLGTTVIVNDSVSEELSGSANGLGVGLSGIGRLLAPLAFGRLYSWSLTNVKGVQVNNHPLGFPFDQYISFFVMSMLATLCAFLLLFVKEDNNHKNLLEQTGASASNSDVEEIDEVEK